MDDDCGGGALLSFGLDRLLRLSHGTRQILLVGFIALGLTDLWRRVLRQLWLRLDPEVLAAALERKSQTPLEGALPQSSNCPQAPRQPRL